MRNNSPVKNTATLITRNHHMPGSILKDIETTINMPVHLPGDNKCSC